MTSIGTRYAGNVHGAVPGWLTNIAAMNGETFGLKIPPVILIWIVVAVLLIIAMRNTVYGRNLYALAAAGQRPGACPSPSGNTGSASTRSAASSPP